MAVKTFRFKRVLRKLSKALKAFVSSLHRFWRGSKPYLGGPVVSLVTAGTFLGGEIVHELPNLDQDLAQGGIPNAADRSKLKFWHTAHESPGIDPSGLAAYEGSGVAPGNLEQGVWQKELDFRGEGCVSFDGQVQEVGPLQGCFSFKRTV
jgi:hypothetical protein